MLIENRLARRLQQRVKNSLYRNLMVVESAQGVQVNSQGKPCVSFASNDYLGLKDHPAIVQAFKRGADRYGVGSGASALICGYSKAHQQLEEALAIFTGRDRVLLFSTGFMANLGVITTVANQTDDAVFEDRHNHASLIDAGLASRAKWHRYAHHDVDELATRLLNSPAAYKVIATDAIFSMDGDRAPLRELATLAKLHQAYLHVDDAHGFGVLGNGRGTLAALDLGQDDVPSLMATFGKALGTFGAFVAGSEVLIESLIQFSRTFIYTTALSPACAVATLRSLELIQQEAWRREKLFELIAYFKRCARQLELPILASAHPIQGFIMQDNPSVMRLKNALFERGFLVGAIRAPTVPAASPRLRINLSAEHTHEQIERLLESIKTLTGSPS